MTSLFDAIDDADREHVLAVAWRRRFGRGETIFHRGDAGDTLHVVERGRVAVRVTTPQGDEVVLNVLGPGAAFGLLALLGGSARRTASVVALEDVETLCLDRAEVEQLRRDHPRVDRVFIELLSTHLVRSSDRLVEALYVPAEGRVRRRVAELTTEYGDGDGEVEIPLTQQEVASMAGTSRATVNKVLRDAEDAGLLELRRGRVVVRAEAVATVTGRTR